MTFYELYGTYTLVFATLCSDVLNMPRNGSKQRNNADTGEVAERFNAAVLKTVEDASPPRVRISASPPIVVQKALDYQGFFVIHSKIFPLYQLAELWDKSSTTSERRTLGRR